MSAPLLEPISKAAAEKELAELESSVGGETSQSSKAEPIATT